MDYFSFESTFYQYYVSGHHVSIKENCNLLEFNKLDLICFFCGGSFLAQLFHQTYQHYAIGTIGRENCDSVKSLGFSFVSIKFPVFYIYIINVQVPSKMTAYFFYPLQLNKWNGVYDPLINLGIIYIYISFDVKNCMLLIKQ